MAAAIGRPVAEILGRTHAEILPPRLAEIASREISAVRASGQPRMSFEDIEPLDGKGARRVLEWRRFALKVDGRDHVLVAGMANDVTERKRLERQLERHSEELEIALERRTEEVRRAEKALARSQRMAAVGTLASGLAHDINNILFAFSGRMERVLADASIAGTTRTDLAAIESLMDHLRQMSKNLSLFARDPEQEGAEGQTVLGRWAHAVRGLIEGSVKPGPGHSEEGVRLEWDVPDDLPPVLIAPHRLTQVVLNLVQNARDAIVAKAGAGLEGGATGCITIQGRAAAGDREVTLTVMDDGCGMSEEVRRRAIEPFFTTRTRPDTPSGMGSGMGLSIAVATIERIGGQFEIESAPGRGTTITLTLPAAEAETQAAGSAPAAAAPAGSARGRT
jgi:PAS domain S-box-containing protein